MYVAKLLDPRPHLAALLLAVALASLFIWQVRQPFTLDVGAPNDDPYLTGFHASEVTPDGTLTYRWTMAQATIAIPAYGATGAMLTLRLQGTRPNGAPPAINVTLGALPATRLQLSQEPREYTLAVPASAFHDGTLRVTIDTPTFRPTGDARALGVAVDRVTLRDAGAPAGLIAPPLAVLVTLLLVVVSAYTVAGLLLRSALAAALAGWVTASVLVALALRSRFEFGLFAPALALSVVAVALGALLLGWLARWARRRWDWRSGERALGGAVLLAAALLLALLLGMRHPQYRSSDLMLNVHRLEYVQRGIWIFTLPLPGPRALEAPYPPAFYATLLPFAALVPNRVLLVEVGAALLTATGVLATFALARRVTGQDGAALCAAAVFSLAPITYAMTSAGNFANLFAQGVANLYLLALALTYGRWQRPGVAVALTAGLTVALLGHFGLFLSLLVLVPLLIVGLALSDAVGRRQSLALALSFALALVVAFAVYYRFHARLLASYFTLAFAGQTNARGAADIPFIRRLTNEWTGTLLWWGWPAIPLAIAGGMLLVRARRSPQLLLTLIWLATAPLFALVALVAGLSVRYHLFVLPALAVCAGWALWRLWRVHRVAGPALALLVGSVWSWQAGAFWIDRVLHAYH